jgi:hypothetical protein
MGDGLKERDPRSTRRATFEKSIVASAIPRRRARAGDADHEAAGNGISALRLAEVVGRARPPELEADHQLEEADLSTPQGLCRRRQPRELRRIKTALEASATIPTSSSSWSPARRSCSSGGNALKC